MIMGCFLTMTLIIAVSLNPYLLTKHSIHKKSGEAQSIIENFYSKISFV
jgi:hypothetical protein